MATLDSLRTGSWLTPARIRAYSAMLLVGYLVALVTLLATSDGLNDAQGRPLGTDFSNVYAAGTFVLEGNPAAPFDIDKQFPREQQIFGADTQAYGWHYPPFFLFLAAALALLPYWAALLLWQASTLPLYLWTIRAITGRAEALLPALAFPAVFVNIGHGHNGFLTAALLGGGLWLLERRPALAGILIGLLAYKPQFGLLIPLALITGGHWRAILAAGATVLALIGASTLAFGMETWTAFFKFSEFTRTVVLEQGSTGWEKIQSAFSAVRMWGGSIPLAYGVQGALVLVLAGLVWRLWRSPVAHEIKAAGLIVASLLATPYVLDYDMMALGPALALLAAHGLRQGFRYWEVTTFFAVWLIPLIARNGAQLTDLPLGLMAMAGLLAVVMTRRESPGQPQA